MATQALRPSLVRFSSSELRARVAAAPELRIPVLADELRGIRLDHESRAGVYVLGHLLVVHDLPERLHAVEADVERELGDARVRAPPCRRVIFVSGDYPEAKSVVRWLAGFPCHCDWENTLKCAGTGVPA